MPEDKDQIVERYTKQISLDTIGTVGQKKISNSSILVIGAGGLGCPALQYLAGMGVGRIGIMDADTVSLGNLHRQILYSENDLGKSKAITAAKHLRKINSTIEIKPYNYFLTKDIAKSSIQNYDIVLDCTDQIATRYLINDTCVLLRKTFIYGALHHYEGQMSVFNYKNSGTYRCLFPENPNNLQIPTCDEGGVMPTVAGFIGVMQANEGIKVLLNLKDVLSNQLLVFDSRNYSISKFKYSRKTDSIAKIFNPESTIANAPENNQKAQLNISIDKNKISNDNLLIDIRSATEVLDSPLPNTIAVDPIEVENYILKIKTKKNIVLICKNGSRSLHLTQRLRNRGITNVQSLNQGIKNYQSASTFTN